MWAAFKLGLGFYLAKLVATWAIPTLMLLALVVLVVLGHLAGLR